MAAPHTPRVSLPHAEQRWLFETIRALVERESPSTDKRAVDHCGALLQDLLRADGATVRTLPQTQRGDHIRAEYPGGPRTVMLLGHFDTVWNVGQIERMPLREENERLYGPGVYDMKASIAVAILAVRRLRQRDATRDQAVRDAPNADASGGSTPRVVMLWTTDEEIGSGTSREYIEAEARASDAVLVLEPSLPGGAAKTRRKGCGEFELTIQGVSAHAGIDPAKGASAIHELAHQIVMLEQLRDLERGISVNVGVISGGTRGNVVAEQAHAVVDVRVPTMADAMRLEQTIHALRPFNPAVRITVTGGVGRPPLERTAGVGRLYKEAQAVAAELGAELGEGATGGGSDGNFTAALGVPTLDGLGPEGDGAHALHEHVNIADLPWRVAFLAALIRRINAG